MRNGREKRARSLTHLWNPSNSMAQAVATVDLNWQPQALSQLRNFRAQGSMRSCRPACEDDDKRLEHSREHSNRKGSGEVSKAKLQADDSRLTWRRRPQTAPAGRRSVASRTRSRRAPDVTSQTMTPSQAWAQGARLA